MFTRKNIKNNLFLLLIFAAGCAFAPAGSRYADRALYLDPVSIIRESNSQLIKESPDAAAAKFNKLGKDLFVFYRGTSPLFYKHCMKYGIDGRFVNDGVPSVRLHGDYHVENLGVYVSESGDFTFDLVDFDDTMKGPYMLDIRRMAVSLLIACEQRGFSASSGDVISAFVDSYVRALKEITAGTLNANFSYSAGTGARIVRRIFDDVKGVDRHEFLEKVCKTHIGESGKRVFKADKNFKRPDDRGFFAEVMKGYLKTVLPAARKGSEFYDIKDVVIDKKGGVGSSGKIKYMVLIEGNSQDQFDDVILEMKEEGEPQWLVFYGDTPMHNGKRVFTGMVSMQSKLYPDIGYVTIKNRDFFVSEFLPHYREVGIDDVRDLSDIKDIAVAAGRLLAKGHVRSAKNYKEAASSLRGVVEKEGFKGDVMKYSRDCFNFLKRALSEFRESLKKNPLL